MSYFEDYFRVILFIPRKCSVVQEHSDDSAWLQLEQEKLMTILPEDFIMGKTGHNWVTYLVVGDSNTFVLHGLWGEKPPNCMFTYCEYSSVQFLSIASTTCPVVWKH